MQAEDDMDISEVLRATGFSASTLHFYERKGLIAPLSRPGSRRRYSRSTMRDLAMIVLCQRSGFTLAEIASLKDTASTAPHVLRDRLRDKDRELAEQAEQIAAAREALKHAVDCPSPDLLRCPHLDNLADNVFAS